MFLFHIIITKIHELQMKSFLNIYFSFYLIIPIICFLTYENIHYKLYSHLPNKSFKKLVLMSEIQPSSGVIVLGMHRSGTSCLTSLIEKFGLKLGEPLYGPAVDNAKGYFERVDVNTQNEIFLNMQNATYYSNTNLYDGNKAINISAYHTEYFTQALSFLNNQTNYPWVIKDPRLCITINSWIKFLNSTPSILFTYRNPHDVALSLKKRNNFTMNHSLTLWYIYNKRAIQNSKGLCRIITSYYNIINNFENELQSIIRGLIKCKIHVPLEFKLIRKDDLFDKNLRHWSTQEKPCNNSKASSILYHNDSYINLVRETGRVYCALKDGTAFQPNFNWDENITD